jgi:NADH-quinone oxidoreductase subunit N
MTANFGANFLAILPEIGLIVLAALVMIFDLVWQDRRCIRLGWFTAVGLSVIIGLSLIFSQPQEANQLIWGGMLRLDGAGFIFRMLFLVGAALTALFSMESEVLCEHGEFYALLLAGTLGMSLMASSADLIMLYLAIETTSIPMYVLAGFRLKDQKSVEAGIKYLLYGAMASAIMLFGFALLYGFTGTTQMYELSVKLTQTDIPNVGVTLALMMVLAGFGFKISAVPFHFWAPDVYEGAPTPVAGFLSTASKAAGFAVLVRVLVVVFPNYATIWTVVISIMSAASMIVGNFLALAQKNIKRLLAYSSIAQAGYILIGVAAGSQLGISGAVYYLFAYLLTNLAAFGIVAIMARTTGSYEISSFAGLSRRSPGLALAFLVALLSLGGIPPFAGFVGKLLVFGAAVQSNLIWLAILGLINSVVGLYYYLTVLKVIYLSRSEDENKPVVMARPRLTALTITIIGVLILGTVIAPWFELSSRAALAIIGY